MFDTDLEAAAVAFFSDVFERHAAEAADAYAVGLYIDFGDDDVRRPIVTADFNSQAGIDAALARRRGPFQRRPVPSDDEESRWDFAFWSHSDLARFGHPDEDPDGADRVMTVVARESQREEIPRALGRPVPVLLHGPVYDSTFAVAAREANPPGLVEDFADWAERQGLE